MNRPTECFRASSSTSEISSDFSSSGKCQNSFIGSLCLEREALTNSNRLVNSSGAAELRYEAAHERSVSHNFLLMISEVGSSTRIKFRCARFVCQKRKWLPKNVEAPDRRIDFEGTLSADEFSSGMAKNLHFKSRNH